MTDRESRHTSEWDRDAALTAARILLEIKAVSQLVDEHRSQVLNYLHATGFPVGLLVNFGHFPKVEYERIVLTKKRSAQPQPVPNFKL